jgi:hypothetical protein
MPMSIFMIREVCRIAARSRHFKAAVGGVADEAQERAGGPGDMLPAVVTSLLDPTGEVVAERQAIADEPRPGSWFGDKGADGRMLTQDETDQLIRAELHGVALATAAPATVAELTSILGAPHHVDLAFEGRGRAPLHRAIKQRGGLDSDPLVRLLAFRAWGHRDRRWFVDRGVRTGDPIAVIGADAPASSGRWEPTEIAVSRPHDHVIGIAQGDAPPGAAVRVEVDPAAVNGMAIITATGEQPRGRGSWTWMLRVSARLRPEPRAGARPGHDDDDRRVRDRALSAAYRFDQLQIGHDPTSDCATIIAVRDGRRAQVRLPGLRGVASADQWYRCFEALLRELERLEATR